MKTKVQQMADRQYDMAEWSNVFNDTTKEVIDHISFDRKWFHEELTAAYKAGFEEGYYFAKNTRRDEWGNFITEENNEN